ncbi:MAG: TetR/AcrR family transcriptional regulator [Ruminococcus sp.]|nr:TetR/AcrR family transcriptional regulator [Ruminococcus sp.]
MPPKPKITKDMIIEAGFDIVRKEGEQSLNVRRVAAELGCSTQPVMYHFSTVNELKSAVYEYADNFHTEYILTPDDSIEDKFLSIGIKYIRFAFENKHLFRFIFQSDHFQNMGLRDLIYSDYSLPVINPLCEKTRLSENQARDVFGSLFICAHGAADLLANNSLEYDEEYFKRLLKNTLNGLVTVAKYDIRSTDQIDGGKIHGNCC